jgi:trafficking protein particle complex subunit 13
MADMQTPSQIIPLELYSPVSEDEQNALEPGRSLQKILRFDLKEEGNHVLAVNVSYTETTQAEGGSQATGGRLRNFRKLYQFIAQPCLSVRTKATEFPSVEVDDKTYGPYGKSKLLRYVLEAQLENVGDAAIVLEGTRLDTKSPFKSTSLNWELLAPGNTEIERPKLNPRSVQQIAFLVEQQHGVTEGLDGLKQDLKLQGRTVLGQLSIEWRGAMGDRGFLTTGPLSTRKKIS